MKDFHAIEKILDYQFNNQALLREALTHPTFARERRLNYDNQRLEFLGDAVIELTLTEALFNAFPKDKEGTMTKTRSVLVREKTLALFARDLGMNKMLLLGNGERECGGSERDSTLSDAFEAFVGALYLDGGFEVVKIKLLAWVQNRFPFFVVVDDDNPKGALQEFVAEHLTGTLRYELLSESGLEHKKTYTVGVFLKERLLAQAEGVRRKKAEANAARIALQLLNEEQKKE